MGVIVVLLFALAFLVVALILTRGKGLSMKFTLPVIKGGPIPMSEAGPPDEIAGRIEAGAERMGIHVSDEDVKRLADQIRTAEEEAKRTGKGETSFALGSVSAGSINVERGEPPATPATPSEPADTSMSASIHAVVVSVPSAPPPTGGTIPVTFDVEKPGKAPRQVTVQLRVPPERWAWLAKGMRLPARVDPSDPSHVEIDLARL